MTFKAKKVIILGIDGLRPDMVNEWTMPNLTELGLKGTWSKNHKTVFPSETRGALTALVTGSNAETNGVFGNQFYIRDSDPNQIFTETTHDWYAADNRLKGQLVTATSLAKVLRDADKKLAVITSSGPGALSALNWQGDKYGQIGFNVKHPQTAFPHGFAARAHRNLKIPAGGLSVDGPKTALKLFQKEVWPHHRPAVSILWFTEVDSAAHLYGLGSPEHYDRMRLCDDVVGEFLSWHSLQPDRDEISIFVVSDHGHITINSLVSVAEELRKAGFAADSSFEDKATDLLLRPGRAAGIWMRRFDPVLLGDVLSFMTEQAWFGGAFTRAIEPGAPDGILANTLALELIGAGGPRAPDLCVNLAAGLGVSAAGIRGSAYYDAGDYDLRLGGGTHGGLHAAELSSVLATYGAGQAKGLIADAPSSITDIAPTVLNILGIPCPATMSGRILRELTDDRSILSEVTSKEIRSSGGIKPTVLSVSRLGDRMYLNEGGLEGAMSHDITTSGGAGAVL